MPGRRAAAVVACAVLLGVIVPAAAPVPTPAGPAAAAAQPPDPAPTGVGGAAGQPNFVVVVTDDQRWDSIGRCSPTFDPFDYTSGTQSCMPQVAQDLVSAGVTFLRGEVTQSLCCPSRASILTGLYTRHHGVANLDGASFDDSATLATWLDAAGYRTGLVGKYLNGYGAGTLANHIPPGWDAFHSFHGFSNTDNPYTNYPWIDWDEGDTAPVVTRHDDADSTSTAACAAGNLYSTDLICRISSDFLAADSSTPFFLYVNPASPHSPQTVAARHQGIYAGLAITTYPSHNVIPSPNPPAYLPATPLSASQMSRNLSNFRLALEQNRAVDDMVGVIHDQLAADGRLADTVWLFISDNGGGTGEHRLTGKQCPYVECHRVPFIVVCPSGVCPGAASGTRDTVNYALNIDLAPTIVDLAGATATFHMDGRSLVPVITNPSAPWRTRWGLYDLDPPIDGVVAQGASGDWYKYLVKRDTGETELYELTGDPWELTNLWNDPAHTGVQADMAEELVDFLTDPTLTITQQPPPSSSGTSATLSYGSDESVTFECSLDGGPPTGCGTGTSGSVTYTGLSAGTHSVTVLAVDGYGSASPTQTVTFTLTGGPGDTQPPTAPTDLVATGVGHDSVALSWGASTDANGIAYYVVNRGGSDIGTTTTTSFTDTSVEPSTGYGYRVAAVDPSGNRSAYSNQVSVTTPAAPPDPPAITGGPGDPSGPSVTFTFAAIGTGLTYECTLDGVTDPCTSPWTYTGLAAGGHSFSVVSVNVDGVRSAPAEFTWTSEVYLCEGLVATIWGTSGDDTITGTSGDDVIAGIGGDDDVEGGGGDDVVCGGEGDDSLAGGNGHDRLIGGGGTDTLTAGNGNDTMLGGNGDDTLTAGAGTDTLTAGAGNDTMLGGNGGDSLWGGAGADSLAGGPGSDLCAGGTGTDTATGCEARTAIP